MADISDLPVPTEQDMKQLAQPGISDLPAPPPAPGAQAAVASGISDLPVPTAQDRGISDLPAPVQQGSVDKELQDRSFFDRPGLRAEKTQPDEISQIAAKHGVDPAQLQQLAPYFGANMQGRQAAEATGYAGEVALGVPQKLYKMSQTPAMEKALDDVQALASGRESYLGLVGQVAAPVIPGVGPAASLGAKIAHGAAIGTVAGAANARRGQEGWGGAFGAGVGGALGGVVGTVSKKLAGKAATPIEEDAAKEIAERVGPDIQSGAQDVLDRQSQSLDAMRDQVIAPETAADLDDNAIQSIIREQYAPEDLSGKLDMSTEEGQLYRQRAEAEAPDLVQSLGPQKAVERVLAQDAIDKKEAEFAEFLTGKTAKGSEDAQSAIAKYAESQGGEAALTDRWNNFLQEQAADQYTRDIYLRPGRENNFANKAMNHISDAQFVLRDIDNRTGIGLEPLHNELNTNYNRMTLANGHFQEKMNAIFKDAQATGVDKEIVQTPRLYQAIDSGNLDGLSQAEIGTVQKVRQYFKDAIDFANGVGDQSVAQADKTVTPLSIPERANYVPHYFKPVRELESDFQQLVNKSGADLPSLTSPGEYRQAVAGSPELEQVVDGLGRVGNTSPAKSGPELLAQIHDLFQTREGRAALETVAKSALERGDTPIPLWMRETNLYKLMSQYTSGTFRHLYLRDPIERMAGKMRVLRGRGAELEAGYVQNLLSDMQGVRQGTAAAFTGSMGDRYSRAIDQLVDGSHVPGVQAAAGVAKAIPSIMQDGLRQIYANVLGLSAHADILHILHPIAKTLPEIGMTPYGTYSLLRGTVRALTNFSEQSQKVFDRGLMPEEMVPRFRRAIEDGIRRNSLYAVPMDVLQKMGDLALLSFRKLDIMNRMITNSMAESMIEDLSKGSKAAEAAMARLPSDIQRSIRGAAGAEDAAQKLSVYFNAATGYNYNRASMSEFGRTMGPFFSTFTKWPTATAGEIISEYREKGLTKGTLRNMEKFIAPLLVFKGADALIKHYAGDGNGEFTEREKMLLGHKGLEEAAPLGSIGAIATGKLFAPPAVDMIMKGIVAPIKEGNPAKAKQAMTSAIQEFVPGAVYVRFLTDDLVTYIKGHRPEGKDFIERTENGARELNK